MFDLFRSSQKGKKILLSVVLGVVALSMLLYLIPGAGAPLNGVTNDQVVAEIGTEQVTVAQVETQIRNFTQGRQMSPDVVSAILPQIVEQTITDRALAYEAKRLGFEITDGQLANNIRSFGQIGNMSPQQYQMYIEQQQNQTVPDFESNVRLFMLSHDILDIAMEGAFVSPAEVEAEFRKRNDMAKVQYIAFDPAKLADQVKPTEQELFREEQGVLSGARIARGSIAHRRSGQNCGKHPGSRGTDSELLQLPQRRVPHQRAREGPSYPGFDSEQTRGPDPQTEGQGRRSFEADQSRRGFRETRRAELRR
jgi:hypothetical protein